MTVYRNDEITLDELIANRPTQLVVSPGPGEISPARVSKVGTHQYRKQAILIPTLASVRMQFNTFRVEYQC